MYYRIVNDIIEPAGRVLDSRELSAGSVRKKRTLELYRQFSHICLFAGRENLKPETAMNIAVSPEVYIPVLKNALDSGCEEIPFTDIGCFMMPGSIRIRKLLDFIGQYQKLCDEEATWIHSEGPDKSCIREFIWEDIRRKTAPDLPSRLQSVFLFDDRTAAEQYRDTYYGDFGSIVSVEIKEQRLLGKYDNNWLMHIPDDASPVRAAKYALQYWNGDTTEDPVWEYLLDGTYVVQQLEGE